ncbi:MAG: hypothetical protein QW356_09070 [Candidatus Hadarchaeales archaeon]
MLQPICWEAEICASLLFSTQACSSSTMPDLPNYWRPLAQYLRNQNPLGDRGSLMRLHLLTDYLTQEKFIGLWTMREGKENHSLCVTWQPIEEHSLCPLPVMTDYSRPSMESELLHSISPETSLQPEPEVEAIPMTEPLMPSLSPSRMESSSLDSMEEDQEFMKFLTSCVSPTSTPTRPNSPPIDGTFEFSEPNWNEIFSFMDDE